MKRARHSEQGRRGTASSGAACSHMRERDNEQRSKKDHI